MKNIIITNPKKLKKIQKAIAGDGAAKLHVLADFDRTLTYGFVNGKKIPSLISVLRDESYLTPDYPKTAQALFAKYHAIETDLKIPLSQKKRAMAEWWNKHFALLIKSGLSKKDIARAVRSKNIKLRAGAVEFFKLLHAHQIPLVIMSSSGLGGDSIALYLKRQKLLLKNVSIISNSFVWDKKGRAVGVSKPIIHGMNKDETSIKKFPVYSKIKARKNVILLGDSPGDVGMVTGFDFNQLIKIGFLNEDIKKNLGQYKRNFDVLILADSDFKLVNKIIKGILAGENK